LLEDGTWSGSTDGDYESYLEDLAEDCAECACPPFTIDNI
jgi:hypothetical protein